MPSTWGHARGRKNSYRESLSAESMEIACNVIRGRVETRSDWQRINEEKEGNRIILEFDAHLATPGGKTRPLMAEIGRNGWDYSGWVVMQYVGRKRDWVEMEKNWSAVTLKVVDQIRMIVMANSFFMLMEPNHRKINSSAKFICSLLLEIDRSKRKRLRSPAIDNCKVPHELQKLVISWAQAGPTDAAGPTIFGTNPWTPHPCGTELSSDH